MTDIEQSAWVAARSLLKTPGARLAAVAETGLFVPLPPGLEPYADQELVGRSALHLALPADRQQVIECWERARHTGGAGVVVRLREPADQPAVHLSFTDLRQTFGVYLALCLPSDQRLDEAQPLPAADEPAGPRFARVTKNELAVFTEVDDATTELLGWSREEMVGRRSLEFIHPEDQDLAVASWMELLGAPGMGRRVRLRHLRKDGSYAWFEITNHNLMEDPAQACIRCEIVDISGEMAAHEALRAREQLLHRLAEALPVGVVQLTAAGDVAYRNQQVVELLGADIAGVEELVAAVSTPDQDRVRAALEAVLGGRDHADEEVELLAAGRHCSVVVRRLDDPTGATTGAVLALTDITDTTRVREELRLRVLADPLTGLLNRAGLDEALRRACEHSAQGVAVLFVDVDRFKKVNDELGHEAGDRLLVSVADALRSSCRPADTVGRLGGDEFLVICPDTPQEAVSRLHARVRRALSALLVTSGASARTVSSTVGCAWAPPDGCAPADLIARADASMYAGKAARALPRQPSVPRTSPEDHREVLGS